MTGRRQSLAALALIVGGALLGLGAGLMLRPEAPAPAKAGKVDIGFAQDMSVHHSQALVMADFAVDRAQNPQLKVLARQIIVSQSGERGMLQGWLALWGAPQLPSGRPMQWMPAGMQGHDHEMTLMPGMATPAQLRELGELRGAAFDREFMTLMTRHHHGGIAMAQTARKHAKLPEVRSLAALMVQDQSEEIATMRRLATRG